MSAAERTPEKLVNRFLAFSDTLSQQEIATLRVEWMARGGTRKMDGTGDTQITLLHDLTYTRWAPDRPGLDALPRIRQVNTTHMEDCACQTCHPEWHTPTDTALPIVPDVITRKFELPDDEGADYHT